MCMKKNRIILFVLIMFSFSVISVLAVPPDPPELIITPPSYCELTNGGVEICDTIDNDCDGTVDEGVCEVPEDDAPSGGGGGGGGGSSPKPVNTTNTTVNASKPPVYIPSSSTRPEENSAPEVPLNNEESSNEENEKEEIRTLLGLPFSKVVLGVIVFFVVISLAVIMILHISKMKSSKRHGEKEPAGGQSSAGGASLPPLKPASQIQAEKGNMQSNQGTNKSSDYSNQRMPQSAPSKLNPEEMPAFKYVESMRKKGVKDEAILFQLRNKGWKEETLSKIFRQK